VLKGAGLDAASFAGHNLRAGFLTSAAKSGASIFKMMEFQFLWRVRSRNSAISAGVPSWVRQKCSLQKRRRPTREQKKYTNHLSFYCVATSRGSFSRCVKWLPAEVKPHH
jgi:hypothetical protein